MRFINKANPAGPLELADVLALFPGICFPPEASLIDFDALGFSLINEGTPPAYDDSTQSLTLGPVALVNDVWTQTFAVDSLGADVLAANQAAALDRSFDSVQGAVQDFMNAMAAERHYDSIQSAALRAAFPGPYHDEGMAYGTWMDTCWQQCYVLMAAVSAGTATVPAVDSIIAALPPLVLPDRAA
jgi:hypothetical protein